MKVTIQSVADRAEVSIGTVSRVLNRDPSVSHDLSRRVQESIEELGYRPLRKKKRPHDRDSGLAGKTIGLLTLGMDRSLSRLPVVTAAIDGIREAATEAGANLQLYDAPNPGALPDWIKRARCDGWLIKGAMQGNAWKVAHESLRELLSASPCVWFHGHPRGAPGWSVGGNDWDAGVLAATHLHEAGHRHVAFLSPKNNHALLKRRQHGFVAACEEWGITCEVASENLQDWTFPLERPKSLEAVRSLLEKLLRSKQRPTAIFVPADSIAVMLYHALAELGLRIPEDISVISVNREEGLIAGLFPSLTTIDIRSEEIGREAVQQIQRLLQAQETVPRQDLQIEPQLIPGDSVQMMA